MNSDSLTYPARCTVVAMSGLHAHRCNRAARGDQWANGQMTPWGDYITERCVTAGEFSRDSSVIVIHPQHDGDEFLGALLMAMAKGDVERFLQLCREKGWIE